MYKLIFISETPLSDQTRLMYKLLLVAGTPLSDQTRLMYKLILVSGTADVKDSSSVKALFNF